MRAPEQKILRKENSVHLPLINTKQNVRPKKTSNKVIQSLQVIKLEEEIKPFEFETQYEYVSVLSNKIRELSHLFKISTGLALNMLMKTQYNIEEFYIVAFNHQIKKNLVNLKKMYSLREGIFNQICSICIEETQQKDLISLCCDHKFCLNCFRNYLLSLMNDEGIFCFLKTCPMAGCKEFLTFEIFEEILKNNFDDLIKYKKYLSKLLISTLPPNKKLCPATNCTYVVTENKDSSTIVCPNNHMFCINCLMFPHLPLTCKEFSLFLSNSKIHGLLDENWILHKTKKCPNCQTDIEKNAGCNHMSCKMCSHEFCWLCLKNWNGHVSTKCSKEQKEIFPKVEEQKKESNEKIKFFQEIIRLREDFVRNKEKTVEVKHKLLQNYNYHSKILESKLRKEEFRDYLMFVTELESFIFLGENYSAFIDVNILEKKRIIAKIREIRQKLISLNFSFRYLKNTVSFADIYKSFNGIKTSSFSQNIFQQIKPLMNDILKITKDRNYNVKKQLLC